MNKPNYTTVSYPASYHCPRGTQELKDYMNDVAFATKVLSREARPTKTEKNKAENKREIAQKQQTLTSYYKFGNSVEKYLTHNPLILDALIDAIKEIKRYFGKDTICSLEILKDASSSNGKLFVEIHTSLEAESALDKLNSFDRNWWFKVSSQIHKHLEFNLEF